MEEHKKYCDSCNVSFKATRDYDKHIKTNKHLKKLMNLNNIICPHCVYKSDDKSNMSKHLKKYHSNIKSITVDTEIPMIVIKAYIENMEMKNKLFYVIRGLRSRYNRFMNNNYEKDDFEVVETKVKYTIAVSDYTNCLNTLEKMVEQYPNIEEEIKKVPKKNIELKDDEESDSDDEELNKFYNYHNR